MDKQTLAGADDDGTAELARLLRILAEPLRLKVLRVLAGGEKNVRDLYAQFGVPQPTMSHHLATLRMGRLVRDRRHGKHVFYSLDDGVLVDDRDGLTFMTPGGTSVRIGG